MARSFGWCFIGAGKIVQRVLRDLPYSDGAYVAAVYSRTLETAQALAAQTGATAYAALEDALADPAVQAVYVATPHDMHQMYTEAALRHGKPVLCEKPFGINGAQVRSMIDLAKKQGVYLMEGMWTRHNPAIRQALGWIAEGRIGSVRLLEADFAYQSNPKTTPARMLNPAMGGGALLDLGVYPVALARMVFGSAPQRVQAMGTINAYGVDSQCAMVFGYENGGVAQLYTGTEVSTPGDAVIRGDGGTIRIPRFAIPDRAILHTPDGEEVFDAGKQGEGFQYEFDAVMNDVLAGRLENEYVTHQFSLDVMEATDRVRKAIGLRYPQDDAL